MENPEKLSKNKEVPKRTISNNDTINAIRKDSNINQR